MSIISAHRRFTVYAARCMPVTLKKKKKVNIPRPIPRQKCNKYNENNEKNSGVSEEKKAVYLGMV